MVVTEPLHTYIIVHTSLRCWSRTTPAHGRCWKWHKPTHSYRCRSLNQQSQNMNLIVM